MKSNGQFQILILPNPSVHLMQAFTPSCLKYFFASFLRPSTLLVFLLPHCQLCLCLFDPPFLHHLYMVECPKVYFLDLHFLLLVSTSLAVSSGFRALKKNPSRANNFQIYHPDLSLRISIFENATVSLHPQLKCLIDILSILFSKQFFIYITPQICSHLQTSLLPDVHKWYNMQAIV